MELVIPPTKRLGSVVVTHPASHGEVPGSNPSLVVLFSLTKRMKNRGKSDFCHTLSLPLPPVHPCHCLLLHMTIIVTIIDCCLFPQCFSSPQQCLSLHLYNSWPCSVSRTPHPPPCETPLHPSSSSYSTSTSTAHALSPWSSVQTVICPQPDTSNPATANLQTSTTSTLARVLPGPQMLLPHLQSSSLLPMPLLFPTTTTGTLTTNVNGLFAIPKRQLAMPQIRQSPVMCIFPIIPSVFLVVQC